jgi:hypothetical protein
VRRTPSRSVTSAHRKAGVVDVAQRQRPVLALTTQVQVISAGNPRKPASAHGEPGSSTRTALGKLCESLGGGLPEVIAQRLGAGSSVS